MQLVVIIMAVIAILLLSAAIARKLRSASRHSHDAALLTHEVSRRSEAPRSGEPPRRSEAPESDQDNWETDWLLGSPGEIQVEVEANIHYRDGRGLETRRDIRIRTMCPYGNDYAILAFCKLRQAHRSFLVSRIQRFVPLTTGQPISDVAGYLKEIYARSPRGATDLALEARPDETAILAFIARESGNVTAKERASIERFLHTSVPSDSSLDNHYLGEKLRELAPNPGVSNAPAGGRQAAAGATLRANGRHRRPGKGAFEIG